MNLVIFEAPSWTRFAPLTLTRPVFALASGVGTLLARQIRQMRPRHVRLWVRPALKEYCEQRVVPYLDVPATVNEPLDEQPAIALNAAATCPCPPADSIPGGYLERSASGTVDLALLAAPGLSHTDILDGSPRWQELTSQPSLESRQASAAHLGDIIHQNTSLLQRDFDQAFERNNTTMRVLPAGPFHAVNWERIRIGESVNIAPGVVLDASAGPIIIDRGATIGANSVIEGPCYIGPLSNIRPLTQLRGGCTIGPSCKIGGEVAASVIQGCSNKVHEGYLGHSYLGEWVNLGASTVVSDIKTTYGPASLKLGPRDVPVGSMFMGSLIGDHTKTAIGTRLMSGSYLGISSMVACSRHCPRFVPSFTFLTDTKQEPYEFRKAVEVATRVSARRDRPWTGLDEALLHWAAETAVSIEAEAPAAVVV